MMANTFISDILYPLIFCENHYKNHLFKMTIYTILADVIHFHPPAIEDTHTFGYQTPSVYSTRLNVIVKAANIVSIIFPLVLYSWRLWCELRLFP